VAETANPRAYAECLTHLAEKSFVRRSLALAQAALGRIRQTSLRVAQILDADRPSAPPHNWKPAVLLVAGFAIACAAGISRAPRLVGFDDSFPRPAQIASVSSGPTIASPSAAFLASYSASSSSAVPQATVAESGSAPHSKKDPVNATFRTSQPRVIPAKGAQQDSDPVQDAYWSVAIFHANGDANEASIRSPQPLTSDLFYVTGFATSPAPITEAVFVIVEGRGLSSGATGSTPLAAYRISVWRVVLRPNSNSATNTIPHKET
jgi:hypothetical protein